MKHLEYKHFMTDHISKWRLSNEKMTIFAQTVNGIILEVAPIANKFIGQPLDNLATWMEKMGSTTVTPLESHRC